MPKAPASLQTFIDRITHPYFQFFAFAILFTMWLPDSTIARFRLTDAYRQIHHQHQTQIRSWLFCGHLPGRRLCVSPATIFSIFATVLAHFCQPVAKPVALEVCEPSDMELCKRDSDGSFPSTCTAKACRGALRNRIRYTLTFARRSAHARAARELQVRPRAGRRLVISWRAIRPGRNAAPRVSSA